MLTNSLSEDRSEDDDFVKGISCTPEGSPQHVTSEAILRQHGVTPGTSDIVNNQHVRSNPDVIATIVEAEEEMKWAYKVDDQKAALGDSAVPVNVDHMFGKSPQEMKLAAKSTIENTLHKFPQCPTFSLVEYYKGDKHIPPIALVNKPKVRRVKSLF